MRLKKREIASVAEELSATDCSPSTVSDSIFVKVRKKRYKRLKQNTNFNCGQASQSHGKKSKNNVREDDDEEKPMKKPKKPMKPMKDDDDEKPKKKSAKFSREKPKKVCIIRKQNDFNYVFIYFCFL